MIRPATIQDSAAIAEIHVRAWQCAYKEILPKEFLENLSIEKRNEYWSQTIRMFPESVLLSEREGGIGGWVSMGRCRDPGCESSGEIFALYVRPESWNQGIGKELMESAENFLIYEGYTQSCLWVLERNLRAIRFYELMQYARNGISRILSIGGKEFTEIKLEKAQQVPGGDAAR